MIPDRNNDDSIVVRIRIISVNVSDNDNNYNDSDNDTMKIMAVNHPTNKNNNKTDENYKHIMMRIIRMFIDNEIEKKLEIEANYGP